MDGSPGRPVYPAGGVSPEKRSDVNERMRAFRDEREGIPVYPRTPNREAVNSKTPLPEAWLEELFRRFAQSINGLSKLIEDKSHTVDEFRVQSLNGESTTQVTLLPDYDQYDEIITSIIVTGPTITQQASRSIEGNVTSPGAGATVTSLISLPAGTYQIGWTVSLSGTLSASDTNNFQLNAGSQTLVSANPGAAGSYPQPPVEVVLPVATTISVTAIAAGTVGAVYAAQLVATPVGPPTATGTAFALKIGKRAWNLELPPTGILVIAPVHFSVDRSADRFLTTAVPGDWSVELTGYADIRYGEAVR